MSEFDRNPDISKTTFTKIQDKPNKFKHKVGSVQVKQTEKEPKCKFCHNTATTGKNYNFIMSSNPVTMGMGAGNNTNTRQQQDPTVTKFMANNKNITLCAHCNNLLRSAGNMSKYLSNMKNKGKIK